VTWRAELLPSVARKLPSARDYIDVAMNVAKEPVPQNRRRAVSRAGFEVRDLKGVGADGAQGLEPRQSPCHRGGEVFATDVVTVFSWFLAR
jgi:hypothetical protein